MFAVVSAEENGKGWRVAIYCDENVPLFGPSLPCPPVFEDPYTLREFLLVKLINGEKATFNTPTFAQKRERTLDALLRDMYQEHSQESKSNVSLIDQSYLYAFPLAFRSFFDKVALTSDSIIGTCVLVVIQYRTSLYLYVLAVLFVVINKTRFCCYLFE